MRFAIAITDETGETATVETKAGDLIRLERQFQLSVGEIFGTKRPKLEHVWFLAWTALRRDTPELPDFEDWIDTVDSVEVDEVGVAEVPLDR